MPSLQAKMFLVFALIATLPLMALSYLALSETRAALAEEVGRSHENTAQAAAAFVGVYVDNGVASVAAETARGALPEAAAANDPVALQEEVTSLRAQSAYEGLPIFRSIVVLDEAGVVLAADPPEAASAGTDLSGTDVYRLPVSLRRPVVLDVEPSGAPSVPVAAPLAFDGRLVGVLVAHLSLDQLGVKLQTFALGSDEAILLAEENGRLLVHPSLASLRAAPSWGDVAPVRNALEGRAGHLEFVDPVSGEPHVAGYASVPTLGWGVVDQVPTSEAYAALTRLSAVLIVLSGILVGGILLASVILARRIVQPVRELTRAARSLAAGHLAARSDAKGRDEIAELGQAFNEMASRISESLDGMRRSEARYRNLVESANDVILTVEPDGTLSFASPQAERLLGFDAADLQGRHASDLVAQEDRARFSAATDAVAREGAPVLSVTHRIATRDGSWRTFRSNFSPVFGADGRVSRVLVVSRDITSQQRQERFRDSSFQMARLVSEETALDALAVQGLSIALAAGGHRHGAVFILGPQGLREAASVPWSVPSEASSDVVHARALAERATATKAPARADDGKALAVPLLERNEAVGALVVETEPGPPTSEDVDVLATLGSQLAVGLRRSLFEQRLKEYASELESRVDERTAELQSKSEEMESFLYSVSHDLKAPLISIEGYAQSLLEDYAPVLEGEGSLYLERIRRNATLMEKLILDILELSRIGRVRETVEPVDMDALVLDVASRLDDRFESLDGTLSVQPDLPRVRGERDRISQLFTNLVENAIKYRHPARAPHVRIEADVAEGQAVFRVTDNGRGIPAGSIDQLFRIFTRLPTPEGMPDPGGTGMGLAIVKRIVDTHGGRLWVRSAEGEGTTFHVALPLEPGAPPLPSTPRERSS